MTSHQWRSYATLLNESCKQKASREWIEEWVMDWGMSHGLRNESRHIYHDRVTSPVCHDHTLHVNESCRISREYIANWVMSRVSSRNLVTRICVAVCCRCVAVCNTLHHVTCIMLESCHTYKTVIPYTWMSRVGKRAQSDGLGRHKWPISNASNRP